MNPQGRAPDAVLAQVGGIAGLVYSSLPVVTFVAVSSVAGLAAAGCVAVLVAALVLLWRLVRRDSVQPALSGFLGVLVCVLIAHLTGQSKGYFAFGIGMSLMWAIAAVVSIVLRVPLVGCLWSWSTGRNRDWRGVRRARSAFDAATLAWTLVFTARFVVQGLLYKADLVGWLGVARIAMGWPLTAVAGLITYLAIKAARRAVDQNCPGTDHGVTVDAVESPLG